MMDIHTAIQDFRAFLFSCGWEISPDRLRKRVERLLLYDDPTPRHTRMRLRLAAHRVAFDLERCEVRVRKWKEGVERDGEAEAAFRRDYQRAYGKALDLLPSLNLPEPQLAALLGVLCGRTDADLAVEFPQSTRDMRDQWRCRARRKLYAADPTLQGWGTLWDRGRLRRQVEKRRSHPVHSEARLLDARRVGGPSPL